MKIAFFWTGDFSRNILESFLAYDDINISLIVSQPDKPVWRKKILKPTPIKLLGIENNIKVLQPEKLKWNIQFFEELKGLDFIIVVAYGKIIPIDILNAPKYWCINVHGSILPFHRWASPIQESIKLWETKTWLTIMSMSKWMDEWDVFIIKEIDIDKNDKTEDIFKKFENIWAELLYKTLIDIAEWKIKAIKQNNEKATYCSKINKSDWEIKFKLTSSEDIYNKYRAYNNWPGIYTYFHKKKLQIEKCFLTDFTVKNNKPWDIVSLDNKCTWVVCNDGKIILFQEVKLEWKKTMDIKSFVNGNKDFINYNLD